MKQLLFILTLSWGALASGQSFEFLQFTPGSDFHEIKKISSMALHSSGDLFIADEESKAVRVFNAAGKQKEVITQVQTTTGTLTLQQPTSIFIDTYNSLLIYDAALAKVIVRSAQGKSFSFGTKGGKIGQFEEVLGIASDGGGYIYVLHGGRKQVDVYDESGRFITWISGGLEPFDDPIAIGVNGKNELYVLESKGPSVVVFDALGNFLKKHRNLGERPGVSLTKPIQMAVLKNGDFFLLDAASCVTTQFDQFGTTIGTIGSKGEGAKGTFKTVSVLATSTDNNSLIAILDATRNIAQVYEVDVVTQPLKSEVKRMQLVRESSSRPPLTDIVTAPNGYRYVIAASDPQTVIAYKDSSSAHAFTLTDKFKEAVSLAVDKESNLYVVDRKAKEILVFDTKGVQVRKFGSEIPKKLSEPTSIAIQSSGTVLVADHGTGTIHAWSAQGIYQKELVIAVTAKWKAPYQLQVDSRDQIYVWDDKGNAIYRVGATGWPVSQKQLRARGFDPKTNSGTIGGCVVDGFDQIQVYNTTTGQLEVYQWDVEPVLRFSKGAPGDGPDGFGSVQAMRMDKETFRLFFLQEKGAGQRVCHFLMKPPTPEDVYHYDSAHGQLLVRFNKIEVPYITGYGLLTTSAVGKDTLAALTSSSSFIIDHPMSGDIRLIHYQLVSISQSNQSDPTNGFDDYFTYANQLLIAERYDEALIAFQSALDRMGRAEALTNFISSQLTHTGRMLAQRGEVSRGMPYLRLAYSITPESKETIDAYKTGFSAFFQQMINREDIEGIIQEAERLIVSGTLRMIVLESIDSVSVELGKVPSENSIYNAILLQKKLVEWDPYNADYYASLAVTTYNLYRFKKNIGTSAMELDAVLIEADRHVKKAINDLKRSNKPYFEAELIQLDILNAQRKFEDAEFKAVTQLSQTSTKLTKRIAMRYRMVLCNSYKGRGRYDLAALEYQRILSSDPQNLELKLMLAEALIGDNNFDEGRQIYQQLLLTDRHNAKYIAQIGRIELLRGNYVEASFQLEKAIKEDPSDRSFYGPLGEAFDGASNYQKALDNYKIAIQHEESRLAQSRRRMAADFEVGRVQADLNNYLTKSAKLHELLGNYPEAIKTYNKLIEIDPANAEAHYGLGTASMRAGLVYDAEKALYNACRLDPTNEIYSNAHANTLKERPKLAANQPPLNILEVNVNDIFPSLYRNYADISMLPIGEVVIANNTNGVITPSSITVFVKEIMSAPTQVSTPAMVGYSNSYLKLNAIFQESILSSTSDQILQIEVEVNYLHEGNQKSSRKVIPFTLRGRNSINWSDKRRLGSFVSPGIDELADYNNALDAIFRDSNVPGVNRQLMKAMQVYSVLNSDRFVYSPDPVNNFAAASTNSGILDNLQFPIETLMKKRGDCDDFVAMFASLMENSGISSAYVDVPGHVFVAFDCQIKPSELASQGLAAEDVIVQQGKVWIPIETTLIGSQNFMVAWKSAADRYYRELASGSFPELVPLADARNVYVPANYIPAGFNERPKNDKATMDEYNKVLASLVSKVKREIIRETGNRYNSETGNVFVKNKYAILLAQIGEKDRAEGVLLEALDLSPENPSVLNNLGNLYFMESDSENAIKYYKLAADADRGDGEIRINVCRAFLLGGDKEQARTWYNKAIEMEPQLSSLYDYLKTEVK